MSTLLPLICTILMVISALLVINGWILIMRGKRKAHEKMMIGAAVFAILFLVLYLTRTIVYGNTVFPGPDSAKIYYTIFLLFHIALAIFGSVLGIITIRAGLKNNLIKHRKMGPLTAVVWILTAITGVIVYYLLYMKYGVAGEPEVGNLLEAIFGK